MAKTDLDMVLGESLTEATEVTQIAELARRSIKPELVEETRTKHIYSHQGETFSVEKESPPITAKAESVASIALLVSTSSVVWHSGDQVKVIMYSEPGSLRDDVATWQLTPTEAWDTLKEGLTQVSQKDFVQALGFRLRSIIREQAPKLLESVRNVTFTSNAEHSGELQTGSTSMGQSVKRAVTGLTAIPEEVTLKVRRWAEIDFELELLMQVYADPDTQSFTFRCPKDELAAAELKAQDHLGGYLTESLQEKGCPCPVVAGKP